MVSSLNDVHRNPIDLGRKDFSRRQRGWGDLLLHMDSHGNRVCRLTGDILEADIDTGYVFPVKVLAQRFFVCPLNLLL